MSVQPPGYLAPDGYAIRFAWGQTGVRHLAPVSDGVVLIDVLRFSTSVDVAVSRAAVVYPFPFNDAAALTFARSVPATVAGTPEIRYTLPPHSLLTLPAGARLVLPSPNGSTCTVIAAAMGARHCRLPSQ